MSGLAMFYFICQILIIGSMGQGTYTQLILLTGSTQFEKRGVFRNSVFPQIVSRHGVPAELLSDRGTAFLSKLMQATMCDFVRKCRRQVLLELFGENSSSLATHQL